MRILKGIISVGTFSKVAFQFARKKKRKEKCAPVTSLSETEAPTCQSIMRGDGHSRSYLFEG